jgi:topoisomerase-4 subunit A
MLALAVVSEKQKLVVHAGKRHTTLKWKDLEHYYGERGRRGMKLPRGFQSVDYIAIES